MALSKDSVIFAANGDPVYKELNKIEKQTKKTKDNLTNQGFSFSLKVTGLDTLAKQISAVLIPVGLGYSIYRELASAANQAKDLFKQSTTTGLSTQTLAGVRHLADLRGIDTENIGEGFRHFNLRIGEALRGNDEAVMSFRRLGIGMDELRGHSPDEVFLRIADAVSSIQSPMQRAAALHELLGRRGQDLSRILGAGGGAIRAAVAEAERFGTALGPARMQQAQAGIRATHEAWVRIGAIIRGVSMTIMSTLGPIIANIANRISDMTQSWVLNKDTVDEWVRAATMGVASFWDGLVEFAAWIVGTMAPALIDAFSAVGSALSALVTTAQVLFHLMAGIAASGVDMALAMGTSPTTTETDPRLQQWVDRIREFGHAREQLQQVFDEIDEARWMEENFGTATPRIGDADVGFAADLEKANEELKKQSQYHGMNNAQIEASKLLASGLNDEQRRYVEQLAEESRMHQHNLDQMQEQEKRYQAGLSTTKSVQGPWDKLQDEIREFNEQLAAGSLSQENYARAVAGAYRQAAESLPDTKFSDAIMAGSKEEANVLVRARYGSSGESVQEQIRRVQQQMLEEQRRQTQLDQQMLDALQRNNEGTTLFVLES